MNIWFEVFKMELTFAFVGLNIPEITLTALTDRPLFITENIKIVWLIKEQIKVDTLSKIEYKQVSYPLHTFPDSTTILKVRNKIVDRINLVLNLQNNSDTDMFLCRPCLRFEQQIYYECDKKVKLPSSYINDVI